MITQYIQTLSAAMAASKKQAYFTEYFGGYKNEHGHITELFQKLLLCGVAEHCMSQFDRGIVEIGAAEGKATVALAETAKRQGQGLLVVDPYNGAQEGTDALYQKWLGATKAYSNITHVKASSLEIPSIDSIIAFQPCFVFVDGLHYDYAAYSDIRASLDAIPVGGHICVDDTNFLTKDAGRALQQAVDEKRVELVKLPQDIEQTLYTYKSWHWARKI